jgi:signal transduction histidine kinase
MASSSFDRSVRRFSHRTPTLISRLVPKGSGAEGHLPVTSEADGIGRYPQDTEAALYFCILEALQNIQKYAQASSAVVRLREDG